MSVAIGGALRRITPRFATLMVGLGANKSVILVGQVLQDLAEGFDGDLSAQEEGAALGFGPQRLQYVRDGDEARIILLLLVDLALLLRTRRFLNHGSDPLIGSPGFRGDRVTNRQSNLTGRASVANR